MPLDMNQAIAQYGTLGALANAVPELKAKLEQGAREEWTPDRFYAEVQQTGWWKSTSETRRQATIIQQTDPATWQQTFANTRDKVANISRELGVVMDGGQIDAYANHSLLVGVDDTTLRNMIGGIGASTMGGGTWAYGSAAADLARQIKQTYSQQGITYTEDSARSAVNEILAGRQTLATYQNLAYRQAATRYPQLKEQLDQGLTVKDIASPYMAQMAQTLEINEQDIDLTDSSIQRALTNRDADGKATTQPLWQFERQLKDDPRWDRTTNAKNQTFDMLQKIGQDWGFSS